MAGRDVRNSRSRLKSGTGGTSGVYELMRVTMVKSQNREAYLSSGRNGRGRTADPHVASTGRTKLIRGTFRRLLPPQVTGVQVNVLGNKRSNVDVVSAIPEPIF